MVPEVLSCPTRVEDLNLVVLSEDFVGFFGAFFYGREGVCVRRYLGGVGWIDGDIFWWIGRGRDWKDRKERSIIDVRLTR